MGLNIETENKKGAFSFCSEQVCKENMAQFQRLEDAVVLMKRQVDYVVKETAKFDEKIKGFQESLDGTLKSLLVKEQKKNKHLLIAYARLKEKHENLMKLWKGKKDTSASADNDIILLKQESQGTD